MLAVLTTFASAVNPVIAKMRSLGWLAGRRNNQEIDEHRQLSFSHRSKSDEPTQLAYEVRAGLELANNRLGSRDRRSAPTTPRHRPRDAPAPRRARSVFP
ncbi:MAG: hypothetical protein M0004_11350 [Actinomycetota bacterium]|nr:hypothetical protein [Actinomycetota bacterium]